MSKKVYVGNLPFKMGSKDLKELFSKFGETEEETIISDKFSGRSKGFGFVTFKNDEDADKAIKEMHEKDIEGRKLIVNEARPMEERPKRDFGERRPRSGGFGDRDRRPRSRF